MSAPERIWMTGEDHGASWSGSFRAFRCSSLDHSNDDGPNPDYPEYIRKDASDMAIAAARAEGVREVVISRIQDLISWLESDADNIHFLPADEVAILRDWLNGKPAAEAKP